MNFHSGSLKARYEKIYFKEVKEQALDWKTSHLLQNNHKENYDHNSTGQIGSNFKILSHLRFRYSLCFELQSHSLTRTKITRLLNRK